MKAHLPLTIRAWEIALAAASLICSAACTVVAALEMINGRIAAAAYLVGIALLIVIVSFGPGVLHRGHPASTKPEFTQLQREFVIFSTLLAVASFAAGAVLALRPGTYGYGIAFSVAGLFSTAAIFFALRASPLS
jgi:hypothetical protein